MSRVPFVPRPSRAPHLPPPPPSPRPLRPCPQVIRGVPAQDIVASGSRLSSGCYGFSTPPSPSYFFARPSPSVAVARCHTPPLAASDEPVKKKQRREKTLTDPALLKGVTEWLGSMARASAAEHDIECESDQVPLECIHSHDMDSLWNLFQSTAGSELMRLFELRQADGPPHQFMDIARRYSVSRWLWPKIKEKRQTLLWEMLRAGAVAKGEGQGSFPERNPGNERAMWLVVEKYLADVPDGSWRSDSKETLYTIFYERFIKNQETRKKVTAFLREHRHDPEVKAHKKNSQASEILEWAREVPGAEPARKEWLFSKLVSKLAGQWTSLWSKLDESVQDELKLLLGPGCGLSNKQQAKVNSIMEIDDGPDNPVS